MGLKSQTSSPLGVGDAKEIIFKKVERSEGKECCARSEDEKRS